MRTPSGSVKVGGRIDVEHAEHPQLDVVGARHDWWSGAGGRDEPHGGEGGEDHPPGWPRRTALGVEAEHRALRRDGLAHLALDEAEDEQRQADDGDEGGDAAVVLE